MSLDVYIIYQEPKVVNYNKTHTACGSTMVVGIGEYEETEWHANITHNMNKMADAVPVKFMVNHTMYHGTLYDFVWRPEEHNADNTDIVLKALDEGIPYMIKHRKEMLKYNPENGWGSYDSFIQWLFKYREVCEDNPNCKIEVSR